MDLSLFDQGKSNREEQFHTTNYQTDHRRHQAGIPKKRQERPYLLGDRGCLAVSYSALYQSHGSHRPSGAPKAPYRFLYARLRCTRISACHCRTPFLSRTPPAESGTRDCDQRMLRGSGGLPGIPSGSRDIPAGSPAGIPALRRNRRVSRGQRRQVSPRSKPKVGMRHGSPRRDHERCLEQQQ